MSERGLSGAAELQAGVEVSQCSKIRRRRKRWRDSLQGESLLTETEQPCGEKVCFSLFHQFVVYRDVFLPQSG